MKAKYLLMLVLFLGFGTNLMSQDGHIKSRIRAEYIQFLNEEGFSLSIDSDGDIKFKKEGLTYYIVVKDEESPQYITVYGPGFKVGGEKGFVYEKALAASNMVNRQQRSVKLCVYDNNVSVTIELPIANTDAFKAVFYKIILYLNAGRDLFREEYDKL